MIISDKVYGEQIIDDPLVLELIKTQEMQRLKDVNQYGSYHLVDPSAFTSRFDHSLGVYFLLKKLKAPREEQISGLLHDIAHTAFSHVIDFVYNAADTQHIHEGFHEKVLQNSEIPAILKKFNLDVKDISDESRFPLLENKLPDICADRIDYYLRDNLLMGFITKKDIDLILESIVVKDNVILLNNLEAAKKMALTFVEISLNFWAGPKVVASHEILADIIREALDKKIITEKDFFLTDTELLEKLKPSFADRLKLFSPDRISLGTPSDHTYHSTFKVRYIDPKVIYDDKIIKVSELEPELTKKVENHKKLFKEGYYIKVK